MNVLIPLWLAEKIRALRDRNARWKLSYANKLMSNFFGVPMQVVPLGHGAPLVTLAGVVVFWYLDNGFKQFVMVKTPEHADGRGRWVSCFGLGRHADVSAALRSVLLAQLGKVFVDTLPKTALEADRVGAAPMFTLADDATGSNTPVQTLVWVVQLQAAQVDLMEAAKDVTVMVVPEFALSSNQISPTHRALFNAASRHVPKVRVMKDEKPSEAEVEASITAASGRAGRVVH